MASMSDFSIFVVLIFFSSGKCERLRDKMYSSFDGVYCFRRMTADGQHGCSSSVYGDTGVVHFVDEPSDVDWLVENGKADPYVPIVPLHHFERNSMLKLKNSKKVSGMLLYNNASLSAFSPEDTCPNRNSGLRGEACAAGDSWNRNGSSLFYEDWGFPMAYVKDLNTIKDLRDCFNKFNTNFDNQDNERLCSVQIQSHMFGAVDTPTCLRRYTILDNLRDMRMCDPLGDLNIYQFANSTMENKNRSVIVVATRQDSLSMFDDLVPGAMNPITSLVTFLIATSYLKEMDAFTVTDKNLLMVLFNGESFDYIGSSRLVYDITKGSFPSSEKPLSLNQIGLLIELDQLSGNSLFYHSHSASTPLVKSFVETLGSGLSDSKVKLSGTTGKLPPASLQRFLMADAQIPAVLISNYDSSYKNPFYNSIADNSSALGYVYANGSAIASGIQKEIDIIALNLAKSLYSVMHGKSNTQQLDSKIDLVDELMHCYLETQNCSFFQSITNSTSLRDAPAVVYVSVAKQNNTLTKLTGLAFAYLTGKHHTTFNETDCKQQENPGSEFYWMTDICVESTFGYHQAYSPAFDIEGYDWSSNLYSSWTESVWIQLGMKMFVKPPFKREVFNVVTGLIVLIISFVIVHLMNAKSSVLFNRTVLHSAEGVL